MVDLADSQCSVIELEADKARIINEVSPAKRQAAKSAKDTKIVPIDPSILKGQSRSGMAPGQIRKCYRPVPWGKSRLTCLEILRHARCTENSLSVQPDAKSVKKGFHLFMEDR